MYITFDTNFGRYRYLPRGKKLMGPLDIGWGLFAQVKHEKIQVKEAKMVSKKNF